MRRLNMMLVTMTAAVVLTATAGVTSAATFSVNPTQIFLSGRTTSSLLTLRNDSNEELRFQLSAFQWTQSASGEIELNPTQDVVFFPALLTLKAGEERRIRVGSTVAPGAAEKTYRIFVEELPPSAANSEGSEVRVLTKMGVPIFIRPTKEAASAALNAVGVRDGAVHFTLANTGTVHFVPQQVKVRGLAAAGQTVFEQDLASWYILHGGRRDFALPIAAADCGRTESVVIEVGIGANVLKESVQTPGGACKR